MENEGLLICSLLPGMWLRTPRKKEYYLREIVHKRYRL